MDLIVLAEVSLPHTVALAQVKIVTFVISETIVHLATKQPATLARTA